MEQTMDGKTSNSRVMLARRNDEYVYRRSNSGHWYVDRGIGYDHVYGPATLAECKQWAIQQIANGIDAEALITLHQVADLLGISYNTAKQWSSRGVLPAPVVVISKNHKRWSRAEVLALGRQK